MVKMPHWPKPVGLLQNETSLVRMQDILSRLDDPHKKLPKTIHVAGTNGKGSAIAFMKAMLEAAGNKVHVYTTPHLVEFNERIVLAGKKITDDQLFEVLEEVRINSEDIQLGFYEATTAAAFVAFAKYEADYLLLETGLGGRLDATNIIENPIITIMSTISLDHTNFLGNDVREIAEQKVHIVKKGSKCIMNLQYEQVYPVLANWCIARGIEYKAFGFDFAAEPTENGFNYLAEGVEMNLPQPSLLGDHQLTNAATAITAMLELGIAEEHIRAGLTGASWPSRLEKMDLAYVPKDWELWIDGAHNPAGAYAMASFIEHNWADKPTYIIYGTTRGRDVADFLRRLHGKVEKIVLTKIPAEPNSYDPEEMHMQLAFDAEKYGNVKEAVADITAKNKPGRLLVLGSLFMRGDL